MEIRTGIGEDSHRFVEGEKKLILGGLFIEGENGLEGNSDSDVIFHSICNAFDVVTQVGSLSVYSDKMCESGVTDSRKYVQHIKKIAEQSGWKPVSVSISVEAKFPKLEKDSRRMRSSIGDALNIPDSAVGLTFTSGEDLSACGQGLGIRATAILTLIKNS